jgi:predicted DNA-binding transcriptional regulator YafY
MRYQPAERLLDLVLELAAARHGLTVADIMARFACGRRTAERLLSSARRLQPQIEAVSETGGVKRWRLRSRRSSALTGLDGVGADELAALDLATKALKRENLEVQSAQLRRLSARLQAGLPDAVALRAAPDLEAMIEAEGLVLRPGPRTRIAPEILATLRHAVLATRKVRIRYRYRASGKASDDTVRPLGFLYGTRPYLVAVSENAGAREIRNFVMGNIETAEIIETSFRPPRGFSLERYARRCFGAFQEAPVAVVWRFSAAAAADARAHVFHPSQKIHERRDGQIEVRFTAGGLREMAWHLVRWGDAVTVVKPVRLRRLLAEIGTGLVAQHGKAGSTDAQDVRF